MEPKKHSLSFFQRRYKGSLPTCKSLLKRMVLKKILSVENHLLYYKPHYHFPCSPPHKYIQFHCQTYHMPSKVAYMTTRRQLSQQINVLWTEVFFRYLSLFSSKCEKPNFRDVCVPCRECTPLRGSVSSHTFLRSTLIDSNNETFARNFFFFKHVIFLS